MPRKIPATTQVIRRWRTIDLQTGARGFCRWCWKSSGSPADSPMRRIGWSMSSACRRSTPATFAVEVTVFSSNRRAVLARGVHTRIVGPQDRWLCQKPQRWRASLRACSKSTDRVERCLIFPSPFGRQPEGRMRVREACDATKDTLPRTLSPTPLAVGEGLSRRRATDSKQAPRKSDFRAYAPASLPSARYRTSPSGSST